ncbi:MAG: T9SS type B sorting domain-containing protein [Eudoraea sp.]
MKKLGTLILFLSLCPLFLFGQGEASHWYFGNNAGLRFNNDGSLTPLSDGKLSTFEGCASISDTFGNLLFYTDGISVYDQRNEIMPNGTELYGDPSSTQSALIVPAPQNDNLFYVFTVDTTIEPSDRDYGLNYSIVDMNLNNGLGEVIEKNINLLKDCSEKISAVLKDCSDNSIWVLTLGPENGVKGYLNTYYAYEVNANGVNPNPVKTTFPRLTIEDARGYLKLSSDGKKMASANVTDGAFIYDFDASTGIVSNQEILTINAPHKFPYGVEFSPSGEFLYIHTSNNILQRSSNKSNLLQYDLLAENISSSEVILDTNPIYRGALQLANNGKIYRTIANSYFNGTPYLGVINSPDERGENSNYIHNAVLLEGSATQGLPPFIQSFFNKIPLVLNTDGTRSSTLTECYGESIRLEAENIPGASYTWFKNGNIIDISTNYFLEILNTTEDNSGRYSLEILTENSNACPIQGEALVKILSRPDPLLNLSVCDLDIDNSIDGFTSINLDFLIDDPDTEYTFYESLNDRNNENPISDPSGYLNTSPFEQQLFYKGINFKGCQYFGEIALSVTTVTKRNSPYGPFYSCDEIPDDEMLLSTFDLEGIANYYENENILFYGSLQDLAQGENELEGLFVTEPASIYGLRSTQGQCLGIDVIQLGVTESPKLEIENSFILCENIDLNIIGPQGFMGYKWYLIKEGQEILVSESANAIIKEEGNYILDTIFIYTINNEEIVCENSAKFSVFASEKPKLDEIIVTDFRTNNKVEINVSGIGEYEYSVDGMNYQTDNIFNGLEPGFFKVSIRDINGCGFLEKEVAVMGYPKFFTPNGDGVNDFWKIAGINERFESSAMIAIFDRYGKLITQLDPSAAGWNGQLNNQELPASDYWFTVKLQSGREINGHFALKR